MNHIKPLLSIAFKYALAGSLLGIALILVLFYTNNHPLLIPIAYDYRILLFGVFIYFSIREFKTYHNSGELHFWQGLIIGVFFYLTVGIIVGVAIAIFAHAVPSFLQEYVQVNVHGLETNEALLTTEGSVTMTKEEFNRQIDLTKATKPATLAIDYFIKSCIIGFFLSILLAVILRTTKLSR